MNFSRIFTFLTYIGGNVICEYCPTAPVGTEDLQDIMEDKLFGQHIVLKSVPNVIKRHIKKENPKKALVISFHGTTGIGKTYVTEMIAKYIYGPVGLKSRFVHMFLGEDYGDPRKLNEYKKELKHTIVSNVTLCERSLFIFSEIEAMQHGMFNILKPYVDFLDNVERIVYRRSIFIFLSNIGGEKIKQVTLEHISSGKRREDIPRNKLEKILSKDSLLTGGFEKAHIILSGLVDFFIPFLPLGHFETKQCILEGLSSNPDNRCGGWLLELVEKVFDEIQFEPPSNLLALNGCKMIDKKVDMVF